MVVQRCRQVMARSAPFPGTPGVVMPTPARSLIAPWCRFSEGLAASAGRLRRDLTGELRILLTPTNTRRSSAPITVKLRATKSASPRSQRARQWAHGAVAPASVSRAYAPEELQHRRSAVGPILLLGQRRATTAVRAVRDHRVSPSPQHKKRRAGNARRRSLAGTPQMFALKSVGLADARQIDAVAGPSAQPRHPAAFGLPHDRP
jgi:hypothetical protein